VTGRTRAQRLEADLTWTGERFERGIVVEVDSSGRIAAVGRQARFEARATQRLRQRALLPGFVNAHSHAFQRGLRGRGEAFPAGAGSFWSWREAMYELVGALDAQGFLHWTLQAFREMRAAGITTVGEFHYLHHSPAGRDFAFDELVLRAASLAGVRLVLLQTFYAHGGSGGAAATPGQQRFLSATVEEYWSEVDRLLPLLRTQGWTLGAVVHSFRAATPAQFSEIASEARRRGLVLHLHAEEQPAEVDDCLAAYGRAPLDLLADLCPALDRVVAVHGTQAGAERLAAFAAAGGRLCVCPTTEANLGDGIPDLAGLPTAALARLALGTDSNLRISMLEEMRGLEHGQRLREGLRGALRDGHGAVAPTLLRAATLGGAEALGVESGAILPGRHADLIAVDLDAPALQGADDETLLPALIFGAGDDAIAATAVGGLWQDHRREAAS
jgi:formimidoylglutamate deiminase